MRYCLYIHSVVHDPVPRRVGSEQATLPLSPRDHGNSTACRSLFTPHRQQVHSGFSVQKKQSCAEKTAAYSTEVLLVCFSSHPHFQNDHLQRRRTRALDWRVGCGGLFTETPSAGASTVGSAIVHARPPLSGRGHGPWIHTAATAADITHSAQAAAFSSTALQPEIPVWSTFQHSAHTAPAALSLL